MDHKARYQALVNFLLPYQEIWRNEIMLMYPRPVDHYPMPWIEELLRFTDADSTWRLAQGNIWDQLSTPLRELDQSVKSLTQFDAALVETPLSTKPQSWVHIIPKKQHELEKLAPIVYQAIKAHSLDSLVDIGGGQGHLAQTVAHHYGIKTISLDLDPELQKIGKRWQLAKWENSPHQVEFRLHRIERNDPTFQSMLTSQTLTTGLHTCGSLAVAHLEAASKSSAAVMNMGCCFHKTEIKDLNLSTLAQSSPLPWNLFALTLASGAHNKTSLKDVQFRQQVKYFRYSLHFLLCDEFGICGPVTLGNCPEKLYYGAFADYAREQLRRLQLSSEWSDEQFETFYRRESNQKTIQQMFAGAIIRDYLGRSLEAAILTDRALWLEELGFNSHILQVFESEKSPRNLMIYAYPSRT